MASNSQIFKDSIRVKQFLSVVLIFGLAHGLYRGVQDNYLAQIVHIDEFERGLVEFFRELPGLLLVFILATMYRFSETKVYKIGIAITLSGLVGLLLASTNAVMVVLFLVVYSLGEHIMMPVTSTISLHLANPGKKGAALGITSMMQHGGRIGGFVVVTILFLIFPRLGIAETDAKGFKIIFLIASTLLLAATLVVLAIKDEGIEVKRSRIYFHKKFSKYYGLEIFYGARKQVFLTFAPYVLILNYGASTSLISLLLGCVCSCRNAL